MSTTTTATPAVPGYGLSAVSEHEALQMLARVLGDERAGAAWAEACRAAGVAPLSGGLSTDQVRRVAEGMAGGEGAIRTMGRSLLIRLRTYEFLSSRRNAQAGAA